MPSSVSVEYECDVSCNYMRLLIISFTLNPIPRPSQDKIIYKA